MNSVPTAIVPHSRKQVRELLAHHFRTIEEFDAFCLDYFPEVKFRFASAMDRLARENLLLKVHDPADVFAALTLHIKEGRTSDIIKQPSRSNQVISSQFRDRFSRRFFAIGILLPAIISFALYLLYHWIFIRSSPSELLRTRMITIAGGSFFMESIGDFKNNKSNESAIHEIQVRSFMIDDSEVTVAAYKECVNAGACSLPDDGSNCNFKNPDKKNHPVNCVDIYQATAFCNWVGKRLPDEAEWEFAARGNESRQYPWGNEPPDSQLCWSQISGTCPIRQYQTGKTPTGISDMAGNVSEWTTNKYITCYNSKQCTEKSVYVVRGGSWVNQSSYYVRSTSRGWAAPNTRNGGIGFRCAKNTEEHH